MLISTLPNLQILDLAYSFHDAAEMLYAADVNAIPIINLRCHAIELFLKSLHAKDIATNSDNGVSLFRPVSGRGVGHGLSDSLRMASQVHREELASGMPSIADDLQKLEGIYQKSRYLYEHGDSLPLFQAQRVCRYLAEKLAQLPRIADVP